MFICDRPVPIIPRTQAAHVKFTAEALALLDLCADKLAALRPQFDIITKK